LYGGEGISLVWYIVPVAAVLLLALVVGVVCRFYRRRKRSKVGEDGEFSLSEEERRAAIIKSNIVADL